MSGEDPTAERLREAFADASAGVGPGPDCADTARIWAAARGELPPAEAQTLVDHALACPACGVAWRLAREVSSGSGQLAGTLTTPPAPRHGWTAAHWAAVAAAVIAAVLIPVGVHEWRAPGPSAYRAQDQETIRPLVPEGAVLPRDSFVLRWTGGPPGTRYSVRLVRSDLGTLTEAKGLDATEYLAPADALGDLASGTVLYWRVEAHLPDGRQFVSDTFSVRIE